MLSHSLGKFFSLCPFEISHVSPHVSPCVSCTFSFHFTALRTGFVSLSRVQMVGRVTTSFFGLFFFGMNNGALSVSSYGHRLQPPKHLKGLS